ncbi:MAG: M50 family metallopeptidase [Kofleriaceae bacterium]
MKPDRLELRTLAIALLASLLLWNLPFGGVLLYPFKLLATWLHEMSHGLVMLMTGNGLERVTIYRDTSGLAHAKDLAGPTALAFIATSGYMGTALWGAVLLVATPTPRAARIAMLVFAGLLGLTTVLVIDAPNGDHFGQIAMGAMAGTVAALAIVLPARWRVAVAHFIAAQAGVNALLDIRVLLRPHQVVNGLETSERSDAHTMALTTFGTNERWAVWFWAIAWLVWSLVVLYIALRISGSRALANVAPFARAKASPRDESDRDGRRRSPETAPDKTAPSAPADTAEP